MNCQVSCTLSPAAVLKIFLLEEERPLVFEYNKKGDSVDIFTLLASGAIYEIYGVDKDTFAIIDQMTN